MKMSLLKSAAAIVALSCAASLSANSRAAILIGYPTVDGIDNYQEYAAAKFFTDTHSDGTVIAPGEVSKIDASKLDCIWIHIDRLNIGLGNLPAEFSDEATVAALKKFVEDGGNLFLTKQATQLVSKIGRTEAKFAPGIYADGDGAEGFDNWTVNAWIGYWFLDEASDHYAPEQVYDHRTLQGVKVAKNSLVPGLYIKRQGTEVAKVLVK